MRRADLVMAIAMGFVALSLMVKSAELPIGWIEGEGPGGGAFPFWLSAGMLVCCAAMVVNWWRGKSAPSRSREPYFDRETLSLFAVAAGSLGAMIGLIHLIGVYFSVPLFLVFYVRFFGRHSWPVSGLLALLTPVAAFFFFEGALRITLPKGYTEPLFFPLYDFIY